MDPSSKTFNDAASYEQAQPEAPMVANGHSAFEGSENTFQHFGMNSDAMVFDFKDCQPLMFPYADRNGLAFPEFNGVRQQVGGYLAQSIFVPASDESAFRRDRKCRAAA